MYNNMYVSNTILHIVCSIPQLTDVSEYRVEDSSCHVGPRRQGLGHAYVDGDRQAGQDQKTIPIVRE